MNYYGVNMNGPWGSILGVVVVTLTGIYWMAANPHLRAFTKKRVEEYFGFETYIRTLSELSAGVYMGNYWSVGCPDILDSLDKFSPSCFKMKILTH